MKYEYIEHYSCGCLQIEEKKGSLLGYCGKHGGDVIEKLKRPMPGKRKSAGKQIYITREEARAISNGYEAVQQNIEAGAGERYVIEALSSAYHNVLKKFARNGLFEAQQTKQKEG